ncbi:MAG: nickel-dependent lactate racemase [Canidatus Methanoxibalbensis ujae]|nr:nickel-dependent lactate racemase [Candidatus Methanoxibalbensis ujae]
MKEEKQLAIFLIATFLVGVTGLLLTEVIAGGKDTVYVKAYRADFYLNGTLSEHFTYEIRDTSKRMLYRVWEAPLSFESLSVPFVEPLSINPPRGTVAYVKDHRGEVRIFENGAWKRSSRHQHRYYEIRSLAESAERNEAGCYKPERFNAGEQEIMYVFRLHPPLECDSEYCHLNLKLATKHLPYEHVTVAIHDPQGLVERIFTHPPMEIRKPAEEAEKAEEAAEGVGEEGKNGIESGSGKVWLITGESPKNTLLEVEMLLSPEVSGIMSGFPRTVENVKDKTLAANSQYLLTYNIFSALSVILKVLILTFPLILLLIYHRYGREKRFTVPKFLSYVPKKRKPWVVNLVFKRDAFDFDEDGFYATLLDLHRRGILRIESDEENLRIKLLKGVEAVFRRLYCTDVNREQFVELGYTRRGTPMQVFRPVVEADWRIYIGNIEYHYFAGYTGGAKALLPGVCSLETISANHSWMVQDSAAAGRIEGNPVREDIEEALAFVGPSFLLNVVLDSQRRIVEAVAGDVTQAHRQGCLKVDKLYRAPLAARADIVLASAGGWPKDINFYQAHKALENAAQAVHDGGIIVLVAECREGIGHSRFAEWLLCGAGSDELLRRLQRQFVLGGHKAAAIAKIRRRHVQIFLVSLLDADMVRAMGFEPYTSVQEALAAARNEMGQAALLVVMPHASSILPMLMPS